MTHHHITDNTVELHVLPLAFDHIGALERVEVRDITTRKRAWLPMHSVSSHEEMQIEQPIVIHVMTAAAKDRGLI